MEYPHWHLGRCHTRRYLGNRRSHREQGHRAL